VINKMIQKTTFFLLLAAIPFSLTAQTETGWFSAKEVSPKVWQIDDNGADNIWLVEGQDSSMLIDTGLGVADLASFVKKITMKPLIVINTHGHPDHSGSNYQFEKVYVHPADSSDARRCNLPKARAASSGSMTQGKAPSESDKYKGKPFNTRLISASENQIFNLGGRRLQVMETPGHTHGSICLLDIENKLLFTGDNNNVLVWLFLQNCNPLHEYLITLEKQVKKLDSFSILFPGHGFQMQSDFINDQVVCVKGILDKSLEAKPYKSFAGDAMISTYGRASVAFNPGNL
jgi:hydroxyacylglutathione hydrolase